MNFRIDGFIEGNDFYEFGVVLPLSAVQLSLIMNWSEPEDVCFVYTLAPEQLKAIVTAAGISVPQNLIYQLGPG